VSPTCALSRYLVTSYPCPCSGRGNPAGKSCDLGPVGFPDGTLPVAGQRLPLRFHLGPSPGPKLDHHLAHTSIPAKSHAGEQPRSFPQQLDDVLVLFAKTVSVGAPRLIDGWRSSHLHRTSLRTGYTAHSHPAYRLPPARSRSMRTGKPRNRASA